MKTYQAKLPYGSVGLSRIALFFTLFLTSCSSPVFKSERFSAGALPSEGLSGGQGRLPLRNGVLYGLPKGLVPVTVERKKADGGMLETTLTLGNPVYHADPKDLFFIRYGASFSSADTIEIGVGEDGLLTKVDTSTRDSLPEVVNTISQFITELAANAAKAAAVGNKPDGIFKITASIDPTNPDDPSFRALRDFLGFYKVSLSVDSADLPDFTLSNESIRPQCEVMICYRAALPYRIGIVDRGYSAQAATGSVSANAVENPSLANSPYSLVTYGDGAATRAMEQVVMLPNRGPIAGIEVVRRGLVENKFALAFNNGMLTSAKYDNPSQFLAAVKIPIDIAKAIVSIPSALFQFRVSSDTTGMQLERDRAILEAQTKVATQKLELMKATQKLEAEGKNPPSEDQ